MKKKLIEVALPLEAINVASAREKSIRHGHPSTLHLWWARRPLAACRAVLFASLVDDPSSLPDEFPTEEAQEAERQRLFRIIERLVKWENSNNPDVLAEAHAEIMKSTGGNPPPVLDPFCGGGSIPLEAQRLGLEAHGSDLNPVPVLITKALIEIPPKFAGQMPINPEMRRRGADSGTWPGTSGLAEDVRYYGEWMRGEAEKRIGHLYPTVTLPESHGGGEATVIAWIWTRTVKCPNPACGIQMPLVRSFSLSTKIGKIAWVHPIVDELANTIRYTIITDKGKPREGTVGRRGANCLRCNTTVLLDYVRAEGKANRMRAQMMAIIAEGKGKRIYLPPSVVQEKAANQANPEWMPEFDISHWPGRTNVVEYGMTTFADLFTKRQLVVLSTLSDLTAEVRRKIQNDAEPLGIESVRLTSYAEAITTYLAFLIDQMANHNSTICGWNSVNTQMRTVFARQAIPMVWDYAESNPFCASSGSFNNLFERQIKGFAALPASVPGFSEQKNVTEAIDHYTVNPLISTDPPYYDNISYADLSDFFYVWLRRSVGSIYPELFSTMLVPKVNELVANPYRFGGSREGARCFFEDGLSLVFQNFYKSANRDFPVTVYYAFKQAEGEDDEDGAATGTTLVSSTGWETMLEALINAGFQITGTWPIRTEKLGRSISVSMNALASSIVLVCRPRPEGDAVATRREFITSLRRELEDALIKMMHGNIAPVDLAQSTIGPGMAVYSRYSKVIEANGEQLRVRTALQIINQELDAILSSSEGDYDGDTRFCLAWFEQFGMKAGGFGEADVLARAKDTSVAGLAEAGVLASGGGKVRLLKREEYPADWNPQTDTRKPVWEATQYLVRALQEGGEGTAARLCKILGSGAEPARDLAYRLYSICERKGWAQEALAYNSLVIAWPEITQLASNPNILGSSPQTAMLMED